MLLLFYALKIVSLSLPVPDLSVIATSEHYTVPANPYAHLDYSFLFNLISSTGHSLWGCDRILLNLQIPYSFDWRPNNACPFNSYYQVCLWCYCPALGRINLNTLSENSIFIFFPHSQYSFSMRSSYFIYFKLYNL